MNTVYLNREAASVLVVLPLAEVLGLTVVTTHTLAEITGERSQLRAFSRCLEVIAASTARPESLRIHRVAQSVSKQNSTCDPQEHATREEYEACVICQEAT